jgi:hypothetical protein
MKSSGEDSQVDIVKGRGSVAEKYDSDKQLAAEVATYEQHIIEKYHQMDLYRAKDKPRSKISFNDLTLTENLNYIKRHLKNSDEAFELFTITKDKFA